MLLTTAGLPLGKPVHERVQHAAVQQRPTVWGAGTGSALAGSGARLQHAQLRLASPAMPRCQACQHRLHRPSSQVSRPRPGWAALPTANASRRSGPSQGSASLQPLFHAAARTGQHPATLAGLWPACSCTRTYRPVDDACWAGGSGKALRSSAPEACRGARAPGLGHCPQPAWCRRRRLHWPSCSTRPGVTPPTPTTPPRTPAHPRTCPPRRPAPHQHAQRSPPTGAPLLHAAPSGMPLHALARLMGPWARWSPASSSFPPLPLVSLQSGPRWQREACRSMCACPGAASLWQPGPVVSGDRPGRRAVVSGPVRRRAQWRCAC